MEYVAIYYLTSKGENIEDAVQVIQKFISYLPKEFEVKGVFIEQPNSSDELNKFVGLDLTQLDLLLINTSLCDDFDTQLLRELSKVNNFEIRLFSQFCPE